MGVAADIQGSLQWQAIVVLIAATWMLVSALQGWRKGLMRHLIGIAALFAAGYLALQYGGQASDLLRSQFPSFFLFPMAVVVVWIVSFNVIVLLGNLFFKRTKDCASPQLRLIYGSGGAAIGAGYALLFIWCFLIGTKIVGRIAENQVGIQRSKGENPATFVVNLAKFKKSLQLGFGRQVLNVIDPLPDRFYRDLDQYSRLLEDREALQKLLEYPGFRRILDSPLISELQKDPEVMADVESGNLAGVLTNRKIVPLLDDPQIRRAFTPDNLEAALNYAVASRGTAERR
jgi:hypothetical protein